MDLLGYGVRIAPAMVLVVALYLLLRGQRALPLRIMVVVIGFLVIRDTLITFGVWGYGLGHGWLPYVRFVNDPVLVTGFAVGSILTTLFLIYIEKDAARCSGGVGSTCARWRGPWAAGSYWRAASASSTSSCRWPTVVDPCRTP